MAPRGRRAGHDVQARRAANLLQQQWQQLQQQRQQPEQQTLPWSAACWKAAREQTTRTAEEVPLQGLNLQLCEITRLC